MLVVKRFPKELDKTFTGCFYDINRRLLIQLNGTDMFSLAVVGSDRLFDKVFGWSDSSHQVWYQGFYDHEHQLIKRVNPRFFALKDNVTTPPLVAVERFFANHP